MRQVFVGLFDEDPLTIGREAGGVGFSRQPTRLENTGKFQTNTNVVQMGRTLKDCRVTHFALFNSIADEKPFVSSKLATGGGLIKRGTTVFFAVGAISSSVDL